MSNCDINAKKNHVLITAFKPVIHYNDQPQDSIYSMKQHFIFILKYAIVGLALGFLYLMVFGNIKTAGLFADKQPQPTFSYAPAINKISPSVVSIFTQSNELIPSSNPGLSPKQPYVTKNFLGSGVIVSPSGHIVTNQHVIEKATRVKVFLWNNQAFDASYVGQDELTDLAIIKINTSGLTPAEFHNSDVINTGDVVLAIGNPFGLNQSASLGIVSATGRRGVHEGRLENFIQTDAAINQGNSGGPLINPAGQVVGISTASYNQLGAEGINFAIPSNTAVQVINSIIDHGKVLRGSVGMYFFDAFLHLMNSIPQPQFGIVVSQVDANSSADKAGIRPYDVITHLNNIPVNSILEYTQVLLSHTVGESIEVRGQNGQETYVKTLVVEPPTQQPK